MKRFIIFILSLFLASGLFADWKQVKIPSSATHTIQAYKNEVCEIVERDITDLGGSHEIIVSFGDYFYIFPYSEKLWNELKDLDVLVLSKIEELAEDYEIQMEIIKC